MARGSDGPYTITTETIPSSSTLGAKVKAIIAPIFTVKFLKVFLGGQALSLLICGTGVTSQLLYDKYKISAPTTQSFANYLLLALVYCTMLCLRKTPEKNFYNIFMKRWWKYILIALVDVEANYLVVKAYQYTTLTSIQLLDCITIPVVIFLSFLILRVRYRIIHMIGVVICVGGIGALIGADVVSGRASSGDTPSNKLLGDILCLIGASLYGVSNVAQEYVVREYTRTEFLGMVGLFGTFISGIQLVALERNELAMFSWNPQTILLLLVFAACTILLYSLQKLVALERNELATFSWNPQTILLLLAFAACMFLLYSLFPVVIKWSSAIVVNLSILTADMYSLLFGLFLFHFTFSALYVFGFVIIMIGVTVYSLRPTKQLPAGSGSYNLFRNATSSESIRHMEVADDQDGTCQRIVINDDVEAEGGGGGSGEDEDSERLHKEFSKSLNGERN